MSGELAARDPFPTLSISHALACSLPRTTLPCQKFRLQWCGSHCFPDLILVLSHYILLSLRCFRRPLFSFRVDIASPLVIALMCYQCRPHPILIAFAYLPPPSPHSLPRRRLCHPVAHSFPSRRRSLPNRSTSLPFFDAFTFLPPIAFASLLVPPPSTSLPFPTALASHSSPSASPALPVDLPFPSRRSSCRPRFPSRRPPRRHRFAFHRSPRRRRFPCYLPSS
ncbi:unnamed protein product [Closterium sp. Yama58-4]|nr:unnamed protein product [Closterium sp. Yama58-4]